VNRRLAPFGRPQGHGRSLKGLKAEEEQKIGMVKNANIIQKGKMESVGELSRSEKGGTKNRTKGLVVPGHAMTVLHGNRRVTKKGALAGGPGSRNQLVRRE